MTRPIYDLGALDEQVAARKRLGMSGCPHGFAMAVYCVTCVNSAVDAVRQERRLEEIEKRLKIVEAAGAEEPDPYR